MAIVQPVRCWCNLAAKKSGLEWACVNNDDFLEVVSGGSRPCWVSMCTVWLLHSFKMTERAEQRICIKFCTKLEHSSMETIWMIQKAVAMGNCWLAASSDNTPAYTSHLFGRIFLPNIKSPGDSTPLQPRFGTLCLLAFCKTKITFEREEISDC